MCSGVTGDRLEPSGLLWQISYEVRSRQRWQGRVTHGKLSWRGLSLTVKANILCVCPIHFLISRSKSHYWKPMCDSGAQETLKIPRTSLTFPLGNAVNHPSKWTDRRGSVAAMHLSVDGPGGPARRSGGAESRNQKNQNVSIDLCHRNKSLRLPPGSVMGSLMEQQGAARVPRSQEETFGMLKRPWTDHINTAATGRLYQRHATTCNSETWKVMKGESMSPQWEFRRWIRLKPITRMKARQSVSDTFHRAHVDTRLDFITMRVRRI